MLVKRKRLFYVFTAMLTMLPIRMRSPHAQVKGGKPHPHDRIIVPPDMQHPSVPTECIRQDALCVCAMPAEPGQTKAASALLGDLLTVLLAPYDDLGAFSGRIRVSVPRMSVGESATTILALVIHELATNSLKYGALSIETGTLDVSCSALDEAVTIVWTESGGPHVEAPTVAPGYGSKLVERSVTGHLRGEVTYDWAGTGLVVTLHVNPDRLAQ